MVQNQFGKFSLMSSCTCLFQLSFKMKCSVCMVAFLQIFKNLIKLGILTEFKIFPTKAHCVIYYGQTQLMKVKLDLGLLQGVLALVGEKT